MQDCRRICPNGPPTRSRGWWAPLELRLDPAIYSRRSVLTSPQSGAGALSAVNATPTADGMWAASLADADVSGFYEARLARSDGATETRRYAVNVDAAEAT